MIDVNVLHERIESEYNGLMATLDMMSDDLAGEISALSRGLSGDVVLRVREIHEAATAALSKATAIAIYRSLLSEIK